MPGRDIMTSLLDRARDAKTKAIARNVARNVVENSPTWYLLCNANRLLDMGEYIQAINLYHRAMIA